MPRMGAVPTFDALTKLRRLAADVRGLRLLVLHGSRARGDAHALSDWDLAYQAEASFDPDHLLAMYAEAVAADRIDLADLDRASALLRHRVASEGVLVYEHSPRAFEQFQIDAVTTWCDLAPVLEPSYAHSLERLRT